MERTPNGRYTVIDYLEETVCDFDDYDMAYMWALTCGTTGEMIDNETGKTIIKEGVVLWEMQTISKLTVWLLKF